MRLQLILCDMLALPAEHLAAESPHEIIVTDLSASLHVEPLPLRDRIQEHIDRIEAEDPEVDAILLGYGLCGGATAGLVAHRVPLVLPRAHDCVTIFLGSRDRYQHEQESTPGTYWFTEDNVKRGNAFMGALLGSSERSDGVKATYDEYVEKYGKENADYLMEALGEWQQHYSRGAFLETGFAPDDLAPREGTRRDGVAGLALRDRAQRHGPDQAPARRRVERRLPGGPARRDAGDELRRRGHQGRTRGGCRGLTLSVAG